MVVASSQVTFRDFLIFQLKLFLDGAKDLVVFNLSIGAMVLDFIAGRGRRPRLFYSVVRMSERWDRWLNLHSVMERLDEHDTEDGLFGASRAGDDSLIGQIEKLVRGGEEFEDGFDDATWGSGGGAGPPGSAGDRGPRRSPTDRRQ